jgi:Bacteriophage minor capsid protein
MAWEEDIETLIVAGGIAAGDIFISTKATIPDGDGPYIAITATGGTGNIRTQNSVAVPAYQRPSAQLRVHATSYVAARTMAKLAYNAVCGVRNRTVNSVWYREIFVENEPFDMGLDDNQRSRVAFNISAVKRPS